MEWLLLTNRGLQQSYSLIAAKADVNVKDKYGKTALIRAIEGKHQEVVSLLKVAGAK